jgi:hypothetical protein
MAWWEGFRRVYFGTTEVSPARDPVRAARAPIRTFNARTDALFSQGIPERQREDRHGEDDFHQVPDEEPDPAATLVIEDLRREIAELEARARQRRGSDDPGRSLLPFHRDEDDDEPDPLELMYDFSSSVPGGPRDTAASPAPAASRTGCSSQQKDLLDPDEGTIPDFDGSFSCDPANGEDENTSRNRNGEFSDDLIQSSDERFSMEGLPNHRLGKLWVTFQRVYFLRTRGREKGFSSPQRHCAGSYTPRRAFSSMGSSSHEATMRLMLHQSTFNGRPVALWNGCDSKGKELSSEIGTGSTC